ncbi:enterochelin esterase-like enzyme [Lewinella aquimaris]|uniref:Enterochelin esterase-like enzyme n=1 Tax=Neolewinella aquimaris TaxID=1835722 RepID=A0A840E8W0_9BACT|nr:alpha/beta hydrolase-fold protein [Neolewinella aquimaris]MBB4080152.1 enterochelin esterase-like enzyme [Neolewinella aquimaris]
MNPVTFFKQLVGSILSRRKRLLRRRYTIASTHLQRPVVVDVYRRTVPPWRLLSLVIFNDGQDLERMGFPKRLRKIYKREKLPPAIVVGVHAGDRLREFGTAARKDDQGRGDMAGAYEKFVTDELVPWLEDRYNIYHGPDRRAIAGFSLGGLSAFDIAWRKPRQFRTAGIFSGSLWYRSKPFNPEKPDANRIVHDYVRRSNKAITNRFWFMAGTDDETSDRNNNGVIDSIDDTLHLMAILQKKGLKPDLDMTYVEVEGGKHEPETWGKVVGDFLVWALKG